MIKVRNWLKPVNFLQFYFRICSNARQDLFSSHKMPKNVQWPRGGDCAFHAFLTLFGTVLQTSCPDGHRTLAGCRPYRSFFSSREFMAQRGDCAFHAFLTLFGTVLRTSCPDGHRTPAGCRPYRSFFSSREFMAERGRFELPVPTSGTTDFESAAFDHSATSP